MVDEILLEKAIRDSGKRKGYLAEKMGCSIQTFRKKCTNKYDFTNTQTDVLCDELGIKDLRMKERIFFKK